MTHSATILGCFGARLRAEERDFFREAQPWGFILFSRNIETPDQTRRLTEALRDAVGRDAPILIDQEGGRVQRMGPPHWRQWLPPLEQMALAGPEAMRIRSQIIAHELRDVGIDVNCAPMADIADPCTHAFLKNRCYGTDPAAVIQAATAVTQGLRAGGVLPVLKHMPGHGRSYVDSHLDLPVVGESAESLAGHDFAPFKALSDPALGAGLRPKMGMTGHLVFTAFDPDRPATQSPRMIRLIREEIGFQGLLMTDDISMEALAGGLAARARASRDAGCDIVLHCNGALPEMQEIVAASGTLGEEAEARAASALAERMPAPEIDIAALDAEFAAQMARASERAAAPH